MYIYIYIYMYLCMYIVCNSVHLERQLCVSTKFLHQQIS